MSVADPSPTYLEIQQKRDLTEALMAGVEAMRDRARNYIGMWPGPGEGRTVRIGAQTTATGTGYENLKSGGRGGGTLTKYELRIRESYLQNHWKEGIEGIASMPFRRAATVEGWDPLLEGRRDEDGKLLAPGWMHNVDRAGRSWRQFLHDGYLNATSHGMDWLIVALPKEGGDGSLEEVRKRGFRPYWVGIRASQVIDKVVSTDAGYPRLEVLRVLETVEERGQEDAWSPVEGAETRIRVYYAGSLTADEGSEDAQVVVQIYNEKDEILDEYPIRPIRGELREIPAVPIYSHAGYLGPYEAEPALYDIAVAQEAHWRKLSRHDQRARDIATSLLFQSGVDYDTANPEGGAETDEGGMIWSASDQGDAKMVETTGAALAALREDLDRLTKAIQEGTRQPALTQPSGNRTAFEIGISEVRANSKIEADTVFLEGTAQTGFELTSQLGGLEGAGKVVIPHDFGLPGGAPDKVAEMMEAGSLTPEGGLPILKAAGWFPDDFDVDAEAKRQREQEIPT